jgi:hypothetical protein
MPQASRLGAFLAALFLTWLLTLWLGAWGPLIAGILAGRFAPRRGNFLYPAIGGAAAWLLWFGATAATAPLVPLARLLGAIVGIGGGLGLTLPLVASLLCGVVAGLGAMAGAALFAAIHPHVTDSSVAG